MSLRSKQEAKSTTFTSSYRVAIEDTLAMQKPLDPIIAKYIRLNQVVNVAAFANGDAWSANLFYSFDKEEQVLYIMSAASSRHSQLIAQNPKVCGTICDQETEVAMLRGLQFSGTMRTASAKTEDRAFDLYAERFPVAKTFRDLLWVLEFDEIKYTDNSIMFGHKVTWNAN